MGCSARAIGFTHAAHEVECVRSIPPDWQRSDLANIGRRDRAPRALLRAYA